MPLRCINQYVVHAKTPSPIERYIAVEPGFLNVRFRILKLSLNSKYYTNITTKPKDVCNILDVGASDLCVLVHRARQKLFLMVDAFQETGKCAVKTLKTRKPRDGSNE